MKTAAIVIGLLVFAAGAFFAGTYAQKEFGLAGPKKVVNGYTTEEVYKLIYGTYIGAHRDGAKACFDGRVKEPGDIATTEDLATFMRLMEGQLYGRE